MEQSTLPAGRLLIRVAVDTGADDEFDYLLPDGLGEISPGQRVEVPFGKMNKHLAAFVIKVLSDPDEIEKSKRFRLKAVRKILDVMPLLDDSLMALARWISEYYVCPLGQVLAAMIPAAVKKDTGAKTEQFIYLASSDIPAVKGKKQKVLLEYLRSHNALDEDSAVAKNTLLEDTQSTAAPLKQLLRAGIIKIAARRVIAALPAVPKEFTHENKSITLNAEQQAALDHVSRQIRGGTFATTLLYGVTDSGKTEVYIRAIEACLQMGKQAIVMLPEIALTAQTVERFETRFKKIAVLHSALNDAQRNSQWQQIKSGDADVVIGARSAVFAPLERLGLIVVDEEHEPSYKQDTVPRYHGRDTAVKRAQIASAHCLLGSATPSLETLANCRTKSFYTMLQLPHRVTGRPMPQMQLVDMTAAFEGLAQKGPHILSPALLTELKKTIDRREQAILLLNRRGYSNYIYCPSCRHSLHCMNCDVTLTFHKDRRTGTPEDTAFGAHLHGGYAICHYCLAKTLVPDRCPLCGKRMMMLGLGSQRLEEELASKLPHARVRRVDSDAMAGQDYYHLLDDFAAGKIDILAGTQILAKGLHFPNVTLVGIVSADTALALPDFRANERTFQLINQVAGRAGRGDAPGRVIVQTWLPDAPVIKYALKYNFAGFVKDEMQHRQSCCLPPVWRMAIIQMRGPKYELLDASAKAMAQRLSDTIARLGLEIRVRGPMPAIISRIQSNHRLQLIVEAPTPQSMQTLLADLRTQAPIRPAAQIYYDVDPICVL